MASARFITVGQTQREAWAEWLSLQPWDLFVTLTSEKQTHPESMLKRFRYCANHLSDHLYGRNWDRRGLGVQWVCGLERTKQGWPHSHAVVRAPLVDTRNREQLDWGYWQQWFTKTGGFCWLEPIRSQADVLGYVTKYVVKDGELELSPNVELVQAPGQITLPLHHQAKARGRPQTAGQPRPAAAGGPTESQQ